MGFELTLILRPKILPWYTSQSRTYGGTQWSVSSDPSHSLQSGFQTHPAVISPLLECLIVIGSLSSWQDPHLGFLTCGVQ